MQAFDILSVSLTPRHYHETEHHMRIFREHFDEKGREAARAAPAVEGLRARILAADRPPERGQVPRVPA